MNKMMNLVCKEYDDFANKGALTAANLDMAYKLVMMKEKLLRIDELEEKLGYSQTAYPEYNRRMPYSMHGGEWDARGSYGYEGDSYRGQRYSMDDGRSMMGDRLNSMMNDPNLSQQERMALKKAMESMR